VQNFLIERGVAPNRLKTVSYGKERPLEICSAEACYAQNRRAVTVLSAGGPTS
jgi:peptidoglycan-associated lipoprotein